MGEAWSDWYAKDSSSGGPSQPDTDGAGEVDMGEYVDATPNQIRDPADRLPASARPPPACPGTAGAGPGGYTFGDFGQRRPAAAEVHADGEIWGETLWDLREPLGCDARPRQSSRRACGCRRRSRRSSTRATRSCRPTAAVRRRPRRRDLGRLREPRHGLLRRHRRLDDPTPVETFDLPPPPAAPAPRPRRGRRCATPQAVPASAVAPAQALSRARPRPGHARPSAAGRGHRRLLVRLPRDRDDDRLARHARGSPASAADTRLARVTRRLAAPGAADVRR